MSALAAKLAAAKKAAPTSSTAAAAASAASMATSDTVSFGAGSGGDLKSFGDVKASEETDAFKGTGSLVEAAGERLHVRPHTPPPKIEAHTGEEDEKTAFQARAVLFVLEQSEWRERGCGNLKVNLQKGGRARLLQRQEGSLKVILNAALQWKMPYAAVGDRAVQFIVCDTSTDDHRSQSWLARFARSDEAEAYISALAMALATVPQPSVDDAEATTTTTTTTTRKKRALDETKGASDDDDDGDKGAKKAATAATEVVEEKTTTE
jgi:hypothetical protein